ncbi:MAG: ABC transporter permease [Gammaproteobacteria bacterium]|nr:ABC transporter permease [Gammaproteobacteria bacterium]
MTTQKRSAANRTLFLQVAWRNLWRNRRRTLLTVAAIAFGMWLVQFAMSFQSGSYGPMIELGTRMGTSHLQVLRASFHGEPRIEFTLHNVTERLAQLDADDRLLQASARADAFALVSNDPHSSAALITGVIPEREMRLSDLPSKTVAGSYISGDNQAFIGAALARNLQLDVGGELVLIGTNIEGGIGAAVVEVVGIFEATAAMERVLVQISLGTFQEAFDMVNQAHRLIAEVEDPQDLNEGKVALQDVVHDGEIVVDWAELMPEISQGIEIDIVSNAVLQFVLILIIVLSIMNTFVMTLFERTRECGMLFAIGMRRWAVYRMTVVEAVLLWLVGTVCGGVLTCLLVVPLMFTGVPIPASEDAMQAQFAFMPTSIYPDLSWWAVVIAPLTIGIGALLSVSVASIRLARLNIISALRTE